MEKALDLYGCLEIESESEDDEDGEEIFLYGTCLDQVLDQQQIKSS